MLWGQNLAKVPPVSASGASRLMGLGSHAEGALQRQEEGEDSAQCRAGPAQVMHRAGWVLSPHHHCPALLATDTAMDALRGWRWEKLAPGSKREKPEWSQCREGAVKDEVAPMSWPRAQAVSSCTEQLGGQSNPVFRHQANSVS